ncbi:calcium/sodium antiporter [Hyphomonas sp. UBA5107]|uniref:calcium/sodium antiporter n=1 Tax=Hyphomonas sp. UBA5107 TaxID=1946636 RepID=UPI000E8EF61C|nr:calcium/sodium antiporter [Hyphomonas sp. UBA5107]HBL93298.1 calcium:sodium antiporter [Hyphomonas sp.]HCN93535.1 calcium:sodium antiporter [Hyphomonas sp.]|tara:strand:- start:272 stop:1261 length:990 start_codon:yes stop_codon:yes gene_type:complete
MPELTLIAALIGGLVIMAFAGDFLVNGAVAVARRLGVSPLIAGIFIVGFGTSAPEMVVSLNAALEDRAGLALGNIVGSNIANIFLVLGIPALIMPFVAGGHGQGRALTAMLVATAVWILLTGMGPLTVLGGILFLAILIAYCVVTFYMARKAVATGEDPGVELEEAPKLSLPRSLAYIVLGIGGLVLGAHLIIAGGVGIAEFYHVPQEWIGLTLLAIGTSLPEIGAAVAAALRRHGEVAIGNVLGSNVFNILGAGGIISLFGPIEIAATFTHYDHWVMTFAALLIGGFILTRARLGRLMGILMLLIYAVYIYGLVNGFDILGLFLTPPA